MMRNVVDQYIKDALSTLLTPVRRVEREKEVSREAQRIDFYVAPAPEPGLPPCPLGLLGRLVARPCGLEHFSATPGAAKVIACVNKHLILCHEVSPHRLASRPMSWVLSSGAPTSAMKALRCEPARGWMKGIYSAPPGLRVGIVVLRELRETRDTLLLRLFARGATLKRAMAELTALPPEAPEVQIMVPIMLRWRQERSKWERDPEPRASTGLLDGEAGQDDPDRLGGGGLAPVRAVAAAGVAAMPAPQVVLGREDELARFHVVIDALHELLGLRAHRAA